jgi:hypothetical protein
MRNQNRVNLTRLSTPERSIIMKDQTTIDKVVAQLQQDIASGDLTAIEELLRFVPEQNLLAYLPEITHNH